MKLLDILKAFFRSFTGPAPTPVVARPDDDGAAVDPAAAATWEGRAILDGLVPSQLRRFDTETRERSPYGTAWIDGLYSLSPRLVRATVALSRDPEAAELLLAAHHSGWVREEVLGLLGARGTPLALGMLVVRSADWVAEVRAAAQRTLREVLAREGAEVLLPCLPLLEEMTRGDSRSAPFARELVEAARAVAPDALRGALRSSPDRRVRRSAARLLAHTADPWSALPDALAQDDVVACGLVAEAALEAAPLALVETLARPPMIARVRALALRRLLDVTGAEAARHALQALFDRAVSVRATAQRFLREADVRSAYTDRLRTGGLGSAATVIAVRGLAETGTAADALEVVRFAGHPSARVRAAVCAALEALDAEGHQEALFAFAADPSRRVASRASMALVRARMDARHLDRLWAAAVARPDASLLPAFRTLDRWRQVLYAVRGLQTDVPPASALAPALLDHALAAWNGSFTAPAPEVRAELEAAIPRVLPRLAPETARLLGHTVRPFLPALR